MNDVSSFYLSALHLGFTNRYRVTIEDRTYIEGESYDFTTQTIDVMIKVEWVNINGDTGLSFKLDNIVNNYLPKTVLPFFIKLFEAYNSQAIINSKGCVTSLKLLNDNKAALQEIKKDSFYQDLQENEKRELLETYDDVSKLNTTYIENNIMYPIFPGFLSVKVFKDHATYIQTAKMNSKFMQGVTRDIDIYLNLWDSNNVLTDYNIMLSSEMKSTDVDLSQISNHAAKHFNEPNFKVNEYDFKIYGDYKVNNQKYITDAEVEIVESINGDQIEFSKLIRLFVVK
ncbi:MAG: hypothetical protein EOP45_01210 [Sphingobacteriaceae bacterium]|nr:MAG: hypothetical protein EOP45_01210 [Sphingobacteriaceae bacterium]